MRAKERRNQEDEETLFQSKQWNSQVSFQEPHQKSGEGIGTKNAILRESKFAPMAKTDIWKIRKYFKVWKTAYAQQVMYEIDWQCAATSIFSVIEEKIWVEKTRAFMSLKMILEQHKIKERIKKEFKAKVNDSGYIVLMEQNFKKATKIVNSLDKWFKRKALWTWFHKWHSQVNFISSIEMHSKEATAKKRKLREYKKMWLFMGFQMLTDMNNKKR
jgi:hypothetical protein